MVFIVSLSFCRFLLTNGWAKIVHSLLSKNGEPKSFCSLLKGYTRNLTMCVRSRNTNGCRIFGAANRS